MPFRVAPLPLLLVLVSPGHDHGSHWSKSLHRRRDPSSRRLLEVRLRALGRETTAAADGHEGLALVRREAPALMLVDLQMPRMGGLEVLRTLRRDGLDLPVIVITAHRSIEAAVEAMKEGAHDFLPKPFDPRHLDLVVRKVLGGLILAQRTLRCRLACAAGFEPPVNRLDVRRAGW